MADLRKTQPEWDRFLGREVAGMFLACLFELQELEDRFSRQRTRVVALGDQHGNLAPGGVRLAGVDLGVNTSLAGFLYVHVVGVQDPRTISLFRARGGAAADLVALGVGDAGDRIDLLEQQNSGLSGSWPLAANSTEDTSDLLRLFPVPDWAVRLKRVWDGSIDKDVRSQDEFFAALETVASRLRDARFVVAEALAAFAT
ncbi:MAG TPA: hypothetical protein DEA08_04200, partial [Planctomycetes bacterium]|nr:hypothetical protein [Planctomycetota bacterium]